MGYNTDFEGELKFTTELSAGAMAVLNEMLGEDVRDHPEWKAPDDFVYLDLELTESSEGLRWNGAEKTYGMVEQVNFIIREMQKVLPEFGLTGSMFAQGEEIGDVWGLAINDAGWAEKRDVLKSSDVPQLTPQQAKLILEAQEPDFWVALLSNEPLQEAYEALSKLANSK